MSVWPAGLCGPYDLAVTGVALWEEAQGACKPSIAGSLRSIAQELIPVFCYHF